MSKKSFETVELSRLNLKVRHGFKLTNEIESIRIENNVLICEGYCFLQKVDKSRIKQIKFLLEDTSSRSRKIIILNDVELIPRKDVTFIYGADKELNYDYSGFRIKLNLDNITNISAYKKYVFNVLINVDSRNTLVPLTKVHSTLGRNKLPKTNHFKIEHKRNLFLILNEEKFFSKKVDSIKDNIFKKTKSTYRKLPAYVKTKSIRRFFIYCKRKLLN